MKIGPQADVLYVLALFGPDASGLRDAVLRHRDWLGRGSGERCIFVVAGDPRHSDDEFLTFIDKLAFGRQHLVQEWSAAVERWGDPPTAEMRECFVAAEAFGIPIDQLPCLVYSTTSTQSSPARFPLPAAWWIRKELADGLAGRMVGVLAQERVGALLDHASESEDVNALDLIAQHLAQLEDGVSSGEALGLSSIQERVLDYLIAEDRRVTGPQIETKTGISHGTLGKALSDLVKRGLLHCKRRRGYRVTSLARRVQA